MKLVVEILTYLGCSATIASFPRLNITELCSVNKMLLTPQWIAIEKAETVVLHKLTRPVNYELIVLASPSTFIPELIEKQTS